MEKNPQSHKAGEQQQIEAAFRALVSPRVSTGLLWPKRKYLLSQALAYLKTLPSDILQQGEKNGLKELYHHFVAPAIELDDTLVESAVSYQPKRIRYASSLVSRREDNPVLTTNVAVGRTERILNHKWSKEIQ